ncbi:uncharacterized protein PHA67_022868 isoform 1-T2 [Liasis olivaceus]
MESLLQLDHGVVAVILKTWSMYWHQICPNWILGRKIRKDTGQKPKHLEQNQLITLWALVRVKAILGRKSEGGQEDPLSDEPVNSDLESCFKSAGPGQNIQMRQTQNNQLWRTP